MSKANRKRHILSKWRKTKANRKRHILSKWRKTKVNRKRHIISKWRKTKAILRNSALRRYVPDTKKMTRASLQEMLNRYSMVYIKPDSGTFGIGVMKVEKVSESEGKPFRYQAGVVKKTFTSFDPMYNSILKLTRRRLYLVQKGIHLTKYRNRRFDIRVMVQQSPRRKWEATGVIGRVAHPKKIVTNFHNGGTLEPIEKLLGAYVSGPAKPKYIHRLRKLGLVMANQLHSNFRGIKEIGLDVALDKELHPWVLEINTSPDPYIFKRLKDKRIFGKIRHYAKAYRRL
ncbi:YheC/YheD family protein [Paenibacillus agricola]|uniref:YheC/YheD family protein n=1 Tax=Paenibacillus agricola TaxID=2716264 RepID=A0ABX0JH52_9BACL|nr:YheC/YheD family protein [Paenibacillus agricola]NHN34561.1 YheC/YheD family protein [Paenibacillus agricola]